MSDDIQKALLGAFQGKKIYRRKRKQRGVDFSGQVPPSKQDVDRGVWCRRCKVRHSYNSGDKLLSQYEKRNNAWILLFSCPKSGDVIGEIVLGGGPTRVDR